MREFQVCGLGNAIVDIFLQLSEDEFAALGLERGTMRLVDAGEQRALLERYHDREPRLISGGSVANSIIGLSQLGGNAAFIGCVGDDRYGLFYESEFEELGIDMGAPVIVGETTGTCLCIITPDAEPARCGPLWRYPVVWRRGMWTSGASGHRTGCSSKAMCSPTPRPGKRRCVSRFASPGNTG